MDVLFEFCFKDTIYLLNFNCSEMSVDTIVAHPLYDGQRLLYDYAILRTKELIPFSRTVNAACLPQFTTPEVTDGKNLQISGWGKESKVYGEYKDTLILKVSIFFFATETVPMNSSKGIQIILRLFLVIDMYCQASSSQFNQSLNLPC